MTSPRVGVVMGSSSDWDTMQHAVQILEQFGVPHEARVVSAHRMPDDMFAYAEGAAARGLKAIIAGAGGATGRGRASSASDSAGTFSTSVVRACARAASSRRPSWSR